MDNNRIDEVIAALSKIETSAADIEIETEKQKNEYSRMIEEKIKAFDEELEKKHREDLSQLSRELEEEKTEELSAMKEETDLIISHLDKAYEKKHKKWAREIIEDLIRDWE